MKRQDHLCYEAGNGVGIRKHFLEDGVTRALCLVAQRPYKWDFFSSLYCTGGINSCRHGDMSGLHGHLVEIVGLTFYLQKAPAKEWGKGQRLWSC